jgi:hypothetical protein
MRAHIIPKHHFDVILAKLLSLTAISAFLGSCSSFPPSSISAGFFGANVTVATPGWSAPVAVVPSPAIQSPALLVPLGSPIADNDQATIHDHNITAFVPIVEAPVAAPVLAVPK